MLIRADAGVEMGTGHVMRCLALAQAWQDLGGTAIFLSAQSTTPISDRISAEGCEHVRQRFQAGGTEDASFTLDLCRSRDVNWIVLDGYAFGAEYQRSLRSSRSNLLCIDDNADAGEFYSNFVLNTNLHACESMYAARAPETRLLLGPKFALLRREFKNWRRERRRFPAIANRILLTMGGTDPAGLTSKALEALRTAPGDIEIRVAISSSNPRINELTKACEQPELRARLEVDPSMPDLMAWADMAIAAAGTTCWELCRFGVPTIVIDVAENQRSIAAELGRQEVCLHAGDAQHASDQKILELTELLRKSPERRQAMSDRGRRLVDGKGAERVVGELQAC